MAISPLARQRMRGRGKEQKFAFPSIFAPERTKELSEKHKIQMDLTIVLIVVAVAAALLFFLKGSPQAAPSGASSSSEQKVDGSSAAAAAGLAKPSTPSPDRRRARKEE
jgi:hypothetical protein